MLECKPFANPTYAGALTQLDSVTTINLHGIEIDNVVAGVEYWLQLFDADITDVILGTTTPKQTYLIPAGDGTLHGQVEKTFNTPVVFAKGMCYAVTTTPGGLTVPVGKVFPASFLYRRPRRGV